MKIPTDSIRNANPGTLVSESAWSNRGRNIPGSRGADEGDPMRGIVKETGEIRRITVNLQTPKVEECELAIPVRVLASLKSWEYVCPACADVPKAKHGIPAVIANDPEVFVHGHDIVAYDSENNGKPMFSPWLVSWRADLDALTVGFSTIGLLMGGWPVAGRYSIRREIAARIRGVRYNDHEQPTPDLEAIHETWKIGEAIRSAAKRAAKQARKRANRPTWGIATVTTSEFIPE